MARFWLQLASTASALAMLYPLAHGTPTDTVNDELAARCGVDASSGDSGIGFVSLKDVADVLKKEFAVLKLPMSPEALAAYVMDTSEGGERAVLRGVLDSILKRGEQADGRPGGPRAAVVIVKENGRAASRDEARSVLTAILAESFRFRFRCAPVVPIVPDTGRGNDADDEQTGPQFVLTKDAEDLALPFGDRPYGEISYTDDAAAGTTSWGLQFTAGLAFGPTETRHYRDASHVAYDRSSHEFTAFVEVDRIATRPTGAIDVNDIALGFALSGTERIGAVSHYYALSAKFLTDDRFDSEEYVASLVVHPGLPCPRNEDGGGVGSFLLCSYLTREPLGDTGLYFSWRGALVADLLLVSDPGHKGSLIDKPEFVRVGWGLNSELVFIPSEKAVFSLEASYDARYGVTNDGGDADLLAVSLNYFIGEHAKLSLSYQKGEDLDSLEPIDVAKVVVGLKY